MQNPANSPIYSQKSPICFEICSGLCASRSQRRNCYSSDKSYSSASREDFAAICDATHCNTLYHNATHCNTQTYLEGTAQRRQLATLQTNVHVAQQQRLWHAHRQCAAIAESPRPVDTYIFHGPNDASLMHTISLRHAESRKQPYIFSKKPNMF